MMNRKPTPHLNNKELELISAYLDGQLPDSQMKQVRQRLSQDPAFKQAYQDLQATRRVLRSAPRIKRRRSFRLTPEMVGKPIRAWKLQRASSLMAVAATVLLAVVFAGDMFLSRGVGQLSMADEMNYAADAVIEDSAEMEMFSAEQSGGEAEVPLAVAPEAAVEEPAVEEAPVEAPAEPAVDDAVGDQQAEDAAEGDQGFNTQTALPTATIAAEATAEPEQSRAVDTGEVETQEGIGAAETEKSTETDGEVEGETQPFIEPESPIPAPTIFDRMSVVTLVELALLALAVGSGGLAWVLKRRRG
ncbi:MAG: hypothetical protein ABFS17_14970 [Chloroflexota bacterium]